MPGRSKVPCPLCGRLIYADHNFYNKNFNAHVEACPQQQSRAARKASRQYQRKQAMQVKKARVGVVPMPGQLGFDIEGIPKVVP